VKRKDKLGREEREERKRKKERVVWFGLVWFEGSGTSLLSNRN